MSRIQFQLPDRFVFATDIQFYISHVNQGGHRDNAQRLTLLSEARVRFFKALGCPEVFYNPKRRHNTSGGVSPVEFEKRQFQQLGSV